MHTPQKRNMILIEDAIAMVRSNFMRRKIVKSRANGMMTNQEKCMICKTKFLSTQMLTFGGGKKQGTMTVNVGIQDKIVKAFFLGISKTH